MVEITQWMLVHFGVHILTEGCWLSGYQPLSVQSLVLCGADVYNGFDARGAEYLVCTKHPNSNSFEPPQVQG